MIYMFFVMHMMLAQVQSIWRVKLAHFRHFWSFVDLGIIVLSWTGVGFYVWRYQEIARTGDLFRRTNGFVSVNLQPAVHIQDTLTYLLSFCCFFSILKVLRLCQFDRQLSLFTDTIRRARQDLCSFLVLYSIIFMAFLMLFYLLFGSTLASCASLLQTAQTLFEMVLLKFDARELIDASALLGPLCFSLFIFMVVFICVSMFVSIVSDHFRVVRETNKKDRGRRNEPGMGTFVLRKLQALLGEWSPFSLSLVRWSSWRVCA